MKHWLLFFGIFTSPEELNFSTFYLTSLSNFINFLKLILSTFSCFCYCFLVIRFLLSYVIVSTMSCLSLLQKESTCFLWIGPVPVSDYQPTQSFQLTNLKWDWFNLCFWLFVLFFWVPRCKAPVGDGSGSAQLRWEASKEHLANFGYDDLGCDVFDSMMFFFFHLGLYLSYVFFGFSGFAFCWRCSVLHVWTLGLRKFGIHCRYARLCNLLALFRSRF